MSGLTILLLERGCRIFLELAYPEGIATIPPPQASFLSLPSDRPPRDILIPPLCQQLLHRDGSLRGYSLRLGSAAHPHLKMQIVGYAESACVFSVDTHDAILLDPCDPDAGRWAEIQQSNRRLKEQIERAWEGAGLLTFNALLRRELAGG